MSEQRYIPIFQIDGPVEYLGPIDEKLLIQHAQAVARTDYGECPEDE